MNCAATGRSKAKKSKHSTAVEPLQEGEEVTDKTGKKWELTKLLSQSTAELLYEGESCEEVVKVKSLYS